MIADTKTMHMAMIKWLWVSLVVLVLDQASKMLVMNTMTLYESIVIAPFINLTYVHNTGAAFSLLSGAGGWQHWFFAILAMVISVVLVVWLVRLQRHEKLVAIALTLVLGGAVGNLIDRLAYGYVIDFVDVYYQQYHWPVFNIADSAICIGVFLMILDNFGVGKQSISD